MMTGIANPTVAYTMVSVIAAVRTKAQMLTVMAHMLMSVLSVYSMPIATDMDVVYATTTGLELTVTSSKEIVTVTVQNV